MRAREASSGSICFAVLLLVTVYCGWGAAVPALAGGQVEEPLLPRELLFGPVQRTWAQLSPDGRRLAYLAPDRRGVMNIWVTGGKAFLNAGNHQYGLKMRDDAIDAVEWAIHHGVADPKRIGVLGFSAGGYLALRVTEARPDLFRATVDGFGPTDVATSLATIPPSWEAIKMRWVRRIGDAEHDEALNRRLSPRFERMPVEGSFLVVQGANDPRVERRLSDDFVALLRKRGANVTYIVYPDEGHGLARPANNLDFHGRVEEFLARRLGGRAQPWHTQAGAHVEVD